MGAIGPLTPSARVARAPVIVETDAGTRVLAWQQEGTGPTDPGSIDVRVAPPRADFGATQTITDGSAGQPSLTAGSDGAPCRPV